MSGLFAGTKRRRREAPVVGWPIVKPGRGGMSLRAPQHALMVWSLTDFVWLTRFLVLSNKCERAKVEKCNFSVGGPASGTWCPIYSSHANIYNFFSSLQVLNPICRKLTLISPSDSPQYLVRLFGKIKTVQALNIRKSRFGGSKIHSHETGIWMFDCFSVCSSCQDPKLGFLVFRIWIVDLIWDFE